MRRPTAKELLADSFRKLAENKPVNRITVGEITDGCGLSPATFYRHFRDKYDLIVWDYVRQTEPIMAKVGVGEYQWQETWSDGLRLFRDQREYIRNLLRNTEGRDAFVRHMAEANTAHLRRCILKKTGQAAPDTETEVCIRVYCCGTAQLLCEWLAGAEDPDCEYLAALLVKALPEPLKPLLLQV
ncbi:MAG: TetR family transcriptional regulator [Abditibacteriota bacterium]|nr:TetR family transcriptional regulator [Abditibacteriota bacterium]